MRQRLRSRAPVVIVAPVSSITPLVSLALAHIFLQRLERVTPRIWLGAALVMAGVAASLSPEQVARFDDDLRDLLAQRFPEDPQGVPHRIFAVVCKSP